MIRKLVTILLTGVICLIGVTSALAMTYNEAPMLRVKVATGELPSVEERLSEEPLVLVPVEEIGQYGEVWTRAWLGPGDHWGIRKLMAETVIKFDANGKKVIPNIAKSWEISENGKVYTFYLRKGMKWSDGHPFTADDMLFYYEDVLSNKELNPVFPKWLIVTGERGKFEKINDYTVRFKFSKPYGLFLDKFATLDFGLFYAPKHYLEQFHPRYTPMDKLEEMAKEAGFDYWYQLYGAKVGESWYVVNSDYPTIFAWKAVTPVTSTRFTMERNPYFWKIDPEGNQLPYIDRVANILVGNKEMISFKAMSGELGFQTRHITMTDYPLFMENRKRGDYRVIKWTAADGANPMIKFNLTCKDLVLRKLFEDRRFRKALSLAIEREEINEICYLGQAEPRQASLPSGVAYYSEEWEKAYAEYDTQKANAFLDGIGLTKRDKEGFRLRSDGKTLALTIEFTSVFGPWPDAVELIAERWRNVGIKVAIKNEDRSLFETRGLANKSEVSIWYLDSVAPFLPHGMRLVPINPGGQCWAGTEYARWYSSGGKAGEKPAGDLLRICELYDKIKVTVNKEERDKLAQEIVRLHTKNIWMIGTVGEEPHIVVVKNNFRNVPENLLFDNPTRCAGNAEPAQFFVKKK